MASSRGERTTRAMRTPMRPLLVAAAVFVLVFLVALGSSRSLARVGGPGHLLAARTIAGDVGVVLFVLSAIVLAGIAYALWSGVRRPRRKADDEPEWVYEQPEMAWWEKPLLLAMALLPAAGLVAAIVFLARHWSGAPHPAQTVVPPSPVPGSTTPSHAAPLPSTHGPGTTVHWWLFAALALVLLAAVAVAFVWRRLHPLEGFPERRAEAQALQAVIEESLEELEREPDPRRAVIRAYTGMERALAGRGFGRRPFEAPLEYLARALVALRVSRPAGERLTELFQRARFSTHEVAPATKQEAIAALARVRDELAEREA
jgi:hypothetical protein